MKNICNKRNKTKTGFTCLVFSLLIFAGCNVGDKQPLFSNDVDTLLQHSARLDSIIKADSIRYRLELNRIKKEADSRVDSIEKLYKSHKKTAVAGTYYVVLGSFHNPGYAEDYANKMRKLGFDGNIIKTDNGFNLVTASSHNNFKSAKGALFAARSSASVDAWIYVQK